MSNSKKINLSVVVTATNYVVSTLVIWPNNDYNFYKMQYFKIPKVGIVSSEVSSKSYLYTNELIGRKLDIIVQATKAKKNAD